MLKINHELLTDVGLVRKANEDACGQVNSSTKNGHVFIVCDGMGGHVGGAIASTTAVNCIVDFFNKEYYDNIYVAIEKSISFANEQIFLRSQAEPELKGMGTTCTVLVQREDKIFIGHVGDSRIYIQSDDQLFRLTKDHSYVQTLVDKGELTDEEMESHPRKNELTKALGIDNSVSVEVCSEPIISKNGDKFLLCSDGLCGLVNDDIISQTIKENPIKNACNALISLANNAGGYDNITVALIEILTSPHEKSIFVSKNNPKTSTTGTQEITILNDTFSYKNLNKNYLFLGLIILLALPLAFLNYIERNTIARNGNSDSPAVADSSKVETATLNNERNDCEYPVTDSMTFIIASAKWQTEYRICNKLDENQFDKSKVKYMKDHTIFSFNGEDYTYQNAKEKFLETDVISGKFKCKYLPKDKSSKDQIADLYDDNNKIIPPKINIKQSDLDNSAIKKEQQELVKEGYLDQKDVDGLQGNKTEKAKENRKKDNATQKKIDSLVGWTKGNITAPFKKIRPTKILWVDDEIYKIENLKALESYFIETKTFTFLSKNRADVIYSKMNNIKAEEVKEEINRVNKELKNYGTNIEKPLWVRDHTPDDDDIIFKVGGEIFGCVIINKITQSEEVEESEASEDNENSPK